MNNNNNRNKVFRSRRIQNKKRAFKNSIGIKRKRTQNSQINLRSRTKNSRIIVRNLAKTITNYDLKKLFEKIGPLKRCGIKWNNLGESKGTADVEFVYEKDAIKAKKKYDYKQIKNIPIRIEIIKNKNFSINNNNNNSNKRNLRRKIIRNRKINYTNRKNNFIRQNRIKRRINKRN